MNIKEAILWVEEKKKTESRKSDGCTLAPDLGIFKWCEMHDFLRYFSPVTPLQADVLFFKGIASEGWRYFPVAVIYFLAVRLERLVGWKGLAVLGAASVIALLIYLRPMSQ